MNKIMETKKKKYVKPKLTVAEWDFNEAVCQQQTITNSYCPFIDEEEQRTSSAVIQNFYGTDIEWNHFPGSDN